MKNKKIAAAMLAAAVMAGTAVPAGAVDAVGQIIVDEYGDEYLAAGDLKFSTLEDGTLSAAGLADVTKKETIKEIVIPDSVNGKSVTSIETFAFNGCTSLTSVTIPNSVDSIGGYVFGGCTSLKSVTIPDGVTSIDPSTFSGCKSLASVTIPDSVTGIGSSAFSGCTSLTNVTIPNTVTVIGLFAFEGCTNLASVIIPDSVTSIEPGTFSECTSLASVTIPDSVTSIGEDTFKGCTSLKDIYYGGTEEQWKALAYDTGNVTVHYNWKDTSDTESSSDSESSDVESSDVESKPDSESSNVESSDVESSDSESSDKTVEIKDDATKITVSAAEEVIPEGAALSVEAVSDKTDANNFTYEIAFKKGETEVQPNGNVTVKIPVPTAIKDKTIYVYHVEDGNYTDMKAKVENGFVVFTTDHFSEYLVTSEKHDETTPDSTDSTTSSDNESSDSTTSTTSTDSGSSGNSGSGSDSPETGFAGVTLTIGVIALAGAAVLVSKKKTR